MQTLDILLRLRTSILYEVRDFCYALLLGFKARHAEQGQEGDWETDLQH